MKKLTLLSCCFFLLLPLKAQAVVVNDVTGMTPVQASAVMQPESTQQVSELVKNTSGPISIAGGKYSMGGQTAINNGIQIDTQKLNHVIDFNPEKKILTIETGATWRQVQELIDPYNLSVKIMQSYANFSIGGSLSVNVHGRYIGEGPMILSVEKFKIVLADGAIVEASPKENQDIFYGAIGGYGGLGVITEVTLRLVDNVKVKRISDVMPIAKYYPYFMQQIRSDKSAIFHNSVIYPPDFEEVRAVTFKETQEPLTILDRLRPTDQYSFEQEQKIKIVASSNLGKHLRKLYDDIDYTKQPVMWRNYEASYDVSNLQPIKSKNKSFALQEYFIPIERFEDFYPELIAILKKHQANVINISIRHANPDSGSLLAWAKTEVFAFVIYYQQDTDEQSKKKVGIWTRELIDAVLAKGGSYYLPYQLHATGEQFQRAYPQADRFFKLKAQLDPENKFNNMLLDRYHPKIIQ
ncbi:MULTISPECIES: FAD-binding oxidoreductase [unclassified Gilliamella]|uniref:FAD-binding oxidoreductase n=1 Tax=unclassified Gilliamella TaxID=2685620 RepID=UPI00080E41A2|nr:FAD-binding oxidoreductase [Gilliamella apicola]OCG37442.1 FAD-binding protein [Gilliamella apicola]OCG48357.1 FAD-binding protein [Gilliamella apicola]OCG50199.1 FAD-binding protein [Gilliamella apicola]